MGGNSSVTRSLRRWLRGTNVLTHVVLVVIVAGSLLPLAWTFSSSLKSEVEQYGVRPRLYIENPTLENYEWITVHLPDIPRQLNNSAMMTALSMVIRVFTASLAGYAFARLRFWGRDAIFAVIVGGMFLPRAGALMGHYELLSLLHLRNTLLGLALTYGSYLSISIFVMRQTFLSVPTELEDAARVDGANPFQIFMKVALPMSTGGMLVVGITCFVKVWGDFLLPFTIIDDPLKTTISVGVAGFQQRTFYSSDASGFGLEAAAYTLAMLPVIILFVSMQKWFIRGLKEGVLKM